MASRDTAHDRLRDLLDDAESADDVRGGPSLTMAAAGALVCLAVLIALMLL